MRLRSLAFTFPLLLTAGAAAADEPPAPPAPPRVAEAPAPKLGPDYRLPMIVTDVLAMGVTAGAMTLGISESIGDGAMATGAGLGYAAFVGSGALYHGLNDVRPRAWKSVLVRTLAPAVFGATGALSAKDEGECGDCGREVKIGLLVGGLIGMLGATVADATILVPEGRTPPPTLTVTPTASLAPQGGQIGLVGRF